LVNRGIQATVLVVIVVSAAFVGLVYTGRIHLPGLGGESQIESIRICGNTSDVLYPELMDATFTPDSSGGWNVTASFVDDSLGPYNLTVYDSNFTASAAEVENINTAVHDGLGLTYASADSIVDITAHMAFDILLTYEDGTWVYLLKLLTEKGHIILLSGTGTPYLNLLDGDLLEPGTALDGMVSAINEIFVNHLG